MPDLSRGLAAALLTLVAAVAAGQQPNPAAWAAYRDNDLVAARDLFRDALRATATTEAARADALQGMLFLQGDVADVLTPHEISAELLTLDHPPQPFLAAFEDLLFPTIVPVAERPAAERFYERALARDDFSPALQTTTRFSHQIYDYVKGDPEAALARLAALHTVDAWARAGDFRNPLGAGYDRVHGPLAHPEPGATFANENNAAVMWHPLLHRSPGLVTRLGDFADVNSTVNYVQSFIDVPADGDYLIALGYGGQVRFYVDDALAYAEEEERHTDLDHVRVHARLSAGPHRLLLALGSHRRANQSFMVRLLDAAGAPVPGVTSSTTPNGYAPAPQRTFAVSFDPTFEEAAACAKTGFCQGSQRGASFAERLTYGQLLRDNGHYAELREYVTALQADAELAPFVVQLAKAVFGHEEDETSAAALEGKVKRAYPEHVTALAEAYTEALGDQEFTRAGQLLDRVAAVAGRDSEQMRLLLISFDFAREDLAGGIARLTEARAAYPASQQLLNMETLVATRVHNDPARARALREAFLADYYLDDQVAALASDYNEAGEPDRALALYRELLGHKPFARGWREAVVGIHEQREDWAAAVREVDTLLRQSPYHAGFHERRGDLLRQLGRERDAVDAYAESLRLHPYDFDLRAKLRDLRGEPSPFDALDSTDARAVIAEHGGRYDAADYPIAQLSDETQVVVYEDGVSEYRTALVYKVLNDRGIELLKEYALSGVDVREARVIKPDGSAVDGERGGGGVVFAKLAVGDYVHLDYRGRHAPSGKFIGHFWDSHALSGWFPQGRVRYQLLVPEGRAFTHEVTGGVGLTPKRVTRGGHEVYTWVADDLPVVPSESFGPAGEDGDVVLRITSVPDWQFVADWYAELSAARVRPDAAVRRQVAALFPDGADGLSADERVRRIYDFVARKIEYSSLPFRQSAYVPQHARKTLASQLGDCKDVSSLFVAMAAEVGVGADLVLVNTRDNGVTSMAVPDQGFNHCIVRLRDSGAYLELTDKHLPAGAIPNDLYGSVALPITGPGSGADLTRVRRGRHDNALLVHQDAELAGGRLHLGRRVRYTGSLAAGTRHRYANESRETQTEYLREQVDARLGKPYRLGDYRFAELETLADTVALDYDLTVERVLLPVQSLRLIRLPWATGFGSFDFLGAEERRLPLALWRYAATELEDETIDLRLPPGYGVLEVPEPVRLRHDGLSYEVTYETEGDRLRARRTWRMDRDEFAPEEYAEVRAFLYAVQEADEQLIALQTPQAE